jgi:hypothetical protein
MHICLQAYVLSTVMQQSYVHKIPACQAGLKQPHNCSSQSLLMTICLPLSLHPGNLASCELLHACIIGVIPAAWTSNSRKVSQGDCQKPCTHNACSSHCHMHVQAQKYSHARSHTHVGITLYRDDAVHCRVYEHPGRAASLWLTTLLCGRWAHMKLRIGSGPSPAQVSLPAGQPKAALDSAAAAQHNKAQQHHTRS